MLSQFRNNERILGCAINYKCGYTYRYFIPINIQMNTFSKPWRKDEARRVQEGAKLVSKLYGGVEVGVEVDGI